MTLEPKPYIATLADYPLVEPPEDAENIVNLSANEHWQGPSDAVKNAAASALLSAHLYPETSAHALRDAISKCHAIDADRIVCANGSSELIHLICKIYCDTEDEIIVGEYGYLYFRTAGESCGASVVSPNTGQLKHDIDAILDKVTPRTRVAFLDNPQNPIGTWLAQEQINRLRTRLPEDVLLVIDSAYAEYVDDDDYEAGINLVNRFDNCVMLRTFSKIYGLAGLRIAWAYAPAEIVKLMHRVRQPNNLSAVSLHAAKVAIQEQSLVMSRRKENAFFRDFLVNSLNDLGFNVIPSETNFILTALPHNAPFTPSEFARQLEAAGVLIRPMDAYQLPDYVRITVGPRAWTQRLIKETRRLLS